MMEIVGVAAITVIAYLVAEILKATPLDNKFLPPVCGMAGGVLGLIAFYLGIDAFPASDPLTAVAVGIVSGLSATGVNQIYKQMKGTKEDVESN